MNSKELLEECAYHIYISEFDDEGIQKILDFAEDQCPYDVYDIEKIRGDDEDDFIKRLKVLERADLLDAFIWKYARELSNPSFFISVGEYFDRKFEIFIMPSTKRSILDSLEKSDLTNIRLVDFVKGIYPKTIDENFKKKFVDNDEWSLSEFFNYIELIDKPNVIFLRFLQELLSPEIRSEKENEKLVEKINNFLQIDLLKLMRDESKNGGRSKFSIKKIKTKENLAPKKIIFAAIGSKPNVGITDLMDNEVGFLDNTGDALLYDNKIDSYLTWEELKNWWSITNKYASHSLKDRLMQCLDSEAEELFFDAYFNIFEDKLGEKLPALIPQVYISYDPLTAKNLPNNKTRVRQRVDFLLILPNLKRVLIEIDGKQHYSTNNMVDVGKYAEMVAFDRELKLRGYEVFRFGGGEFYNHNHSPVQNSHTIVENFFNKLFRLYEVSE